MERFAMKKSLPAAALLFASCGFRPVGHVDASLSTRGVFPSAAASLSFNGGFADFRSNFNSTVQGAGADPNQIDSVAIKSFTMTVIDPTSDQPSFRGLTF